MTDGSAGETGTKPLRADAVRNRARVLVAARDQITLHGPGIGMDEIAAAAGVAVGTVYRHFPTKSELVSAVVGEFLAQVADRSEAAADRVRGGAQAFEQLAALLRDIVIATATNQAAKAAAAVLDASDGDDGHTGRAAVALQSIIDSARADGAVRPDLSLDDFYLLVSAIPADQTPAALARWTDFALFGIVGQPS